MGFTTSSGVKTHKSKIITISKKDLSQHCDGSFFMERGVGYVSTIYRFFFRVFTLEDRTLLRERGAFEVDFRERGVWGRLRLHM